MNLILKKLNFGFRARLPLVMQSENAECGLACISMIANYYGYKCDLVTLRSKFDTSSRGMTLTHLVEISHSIGFSTRSLRIELDEIVLVKTPCIIHWGFNHFVVLNKTTKCRNGLLKSAEIFDPARGKRTISRNQFSSEFTGVLLELAPAPSFKKEDLRRKIKFKEVLQNSIGLKHTIVQILALAMVAEVFALISPFYLQLIIDNAILTSDVKTILTLAAIFLVLLLFHEGLKALRAWYLLFISTHLNYQWVSMAFIHLLKLPLPFFERRNVGDICSKFGAVSIIEQTITTKFVETIIDGILSIFILSLLFLYDSQLTVVLLFFLFLYIATRLSTVYSFQSTKSEQITLSAKENNIFLETLNGVQSIKLFNQESNRHTVWQNAFVDVLNQKVQIKQIEITYQTIENILKGVENIIIIAFASYFVISNKFSLGMLFAYITYKSLFASRVYSFFDSILIFKMLSLQVDRLTDILGTDIENTKEKYAPEGENTIFTAHRYISEDLQLRIELKNVSFRYSSIDPWILRNVTLAIDHGDSIAITGTSGSGKTTLLKIMLGVLDPTEGEILISGIPLEKFGQHNFRNLIGVVMQDDRMFTGSIAENITFFDHKIDYKFMSECAKKAAIDVEIEKMHMGYNTLVNGTGTLLSGGQKQRILLARALYKKPKVLFLDEATSHLDSLNENHINKEIFELNITKIMVAHRTETIKSAKRLIRIDAGLIVEDRLLHKEK